MVFAGQFRLAKKLQVGNFRFGYEAGFFRRETLNVAPLVFSDLDKVTARACLIKADLHTNFVSSLLSH